MSLSSFLLKSTGNIDTELDALFKTKPPPAPRSITTHVPSPPFPSESEVFPRKRKLGSQQFTAPHKRQKPDPKEDKINEALPQKSKAKSRAPIKATTENDQDENSDLETNYIHSKIKKDVREETSDDGAEEDSAEGVEALSSKVVHESLSGKGKSKSKSKIKKQKYVPADETPAQRDQRTIFVGNLSLEVAQKRPLQKQLQRHILSFIPTAKIESIRFRSVPFSSPSTTTAPTATDSTSTPEHKSPSQLSHSRSRATTWRSNTDDASTENTKPTENTHLTPNQKKKYLFVTHQFHASGTTVHAYIVFAHPGPPSMAPRPSNVPPLEKVLDPYEAAREAVKKADGSSFHERLIRVDFVGKIRIKHVRGNVEVEGGGGHAEKVFQNIDSKTTVFVGNLDLGSQEDDLRAFFESLMKTERGEPSLCEDDGKKRRTWVTRVRIIRDKDTQVGKGIGYVQFADRECVDEILSLEPSQLKFAKRKLRVQRCKTVPGMKLPSSLKSQLSSEPKSKSSNNPSSSSSKPPQRAPPTLITIPKGDPTLGTKLSSLSKEERKVVKAADADRVARRLAKKKARMSMGTSKDSGVQEKKRERVRKSSSGGFSGSDRLKKGKGEDKKKGRRVRSDKSLEKRNVKK